MASDVPPFLEEGTPVSAKFKGAFCEATIKSAKKLVKCKVLYKDGSGSAVVNSDLIQGDLKLNTVVQVKQDDGEFKDVTLQKMNDHSLYTVVFDDGDERTLRRTNVCVMGERHFQEHDNLDNLPLTDPENFGTPVLLAADKRRKRRRSQPTMEEEDSDSDGTKPSKKMSDVEKEYLGKVVCVEQGERKKSWFPALGLKRFASHSDNHIYVQSFKDGKKLLVKIDDIKDFTKEKEPLSTFYKGDTKVDPVLKTAIDKALAYHNLGELPKGWNILDTIDEKDESSDDEASAVPVTVLSPDAKAFQENIYSFMKREGNPLTKPPMINNQAVDLHKLYELVLERGGMEEVSNPQWRTIYTQLGLRNIPTTASYNMKSLYKKYLFKYEEHLRNSLKSSPSRTTKAAKTKRTPISKEAKEIKDDDKASTVSESDSEPDRRRSTRSSKAALDKSLEPTEKRKRSNLLLQDSNTDTSSNVMKIKEPSPEQDIEIKSEAEDIDVVNSPQSSETSEDIEKDDTRIQIGKYKPGSKIAVRYGSGKNLRIYNAKVLEVDKDDKDEVLYYIHYNGWNHRHDEWIKDDRINGLSNSSTQRGKKPTAPPTSHSKIPKDPPPKYKVKFETEANSSSSFKRSTSTASSTGSVNEKPPSVSTPAQEPIKTKTSKSPPPQIEKPPSPLKTPTFTTVEAPVVVQPEPVVKPIPTAKKVLHHPKPVNEALFIPDIKPSPVKPRLTRNSMQDQFLLNALEESIGKTNQAAMSLQQDVLMKAEVPVNRRRSVRQHHPSPRSDHAESDQSGKDEREMDGVITSETKVKDEPIVEEKPFPVETKESSKEDTVKKWIEDTSKVMSDTLPQSRTRVEPKLENVEAKVELCVNDDNDSKVTRAKKSKTTTDIPEDKNKTSESSDSDVEAKEISQTEQKTTMSNETNVPPGNDNNNLKSEKDRTSETAQTLSDFCNIVESIPKLEPAEPLHTTTVPEERKLSDSSTQSKDAEYKTKKKREKKRRRTHSTNEGDEKHSKESKGRKMSPPLEYNVDFMSDLEVTLKEKDPVERIVIMQSRLNQMRKLYCKLRTEVANIDRRKRRKLRKQLENKSKGNS